MDRNGRRRLFSTALFLAGFAWMALPLAADPLAQGIPQSADSLSAAVDRLFGRWHRPDSPGAAVLVLRDGKVVHARGYGMADLEHGVPIRPSSVFDIASVSKQFGAMAVALLEAEGRLSVDDDVKKYIPELPDFGHRITIRHLVHHTSGIRDWPGTLAIGGWDYQDVISFPQILRMAFQQRELNFVPGAEHAYSNTGYNLLAETVARVSGMSFREFCQERIFGPLGMTRTHFHDDHTEIVTDRAHSYRRGPDGEYHLVWNSLTALGSSSLFTTAADLARWAGNFENPVVGGPAVIRRMQERGVLNGGDTIAYAWGQSLGRYRGLETWSHGGSWAGYRTTLVRFPQQRFAVVILGNTAEMNPAVLANGVADVYLADVFTEAGPAAPQPPEAAPETWQPSAAELEAYAGEYRSEELLTSWRVEVRAGALVARHFRTGDTPLRPLTPDHFRGGAFGEVHFVRDEAGRVTAFTANQTRIRGLRFVRVR
ncbi:MAG: serine hydrolase domain-containing protein [Longimicrobiales bacterium]|nr:serine hydrolase domain-containing protein [Longimicrobiales bacterium]